MAFVDQRHVTEETLNEAIVTVINAYRHFPLQDLWGTGSSALADGTKWDLYPQNLMAESHIRYGGSGGIGYYLIADTYIALFSRFTTCGSWEGHYILDFVTENRSEVRLDTVHADTQGQSAAIFGLAYLPGIQLMPRIRHWKDLHLYRPGPDSRYAHIDVLFTAQVDWAWRSSTTMIVGRRWSRVVAVRATARNSRNLSWSLCVEVDGFVTWADAWPLCGNHLMTSASSPCRDQANVL